MTQASAVPPRIIETVNLLVRTKQRIFLQTGREPTSDELAEKLAMNPDRIRMLLDIASAPVRG